MYYLNFFHFFSILDGEAPLQAADKRPQRCVSSIESSAGSGEKIVFGLVQPVPSPQTINLPPKPSNLMLICASFITDIIMFNALKFQIFESMICLILVIDPRSKTRKTWLDLV